MMKSLPLENEYIRAIRHVIETERQGLQASIPKRYEMSAMLRMSFFETDHVGKRINAYANVCNDAQVALRNFIFEKHRECLKMASHRFTLEEWRQMAGAELEAFNNSCLEFASTLVNGDNAAAEKARETWGVYRFFDTLGFDEQLIADDVLWRPHKIGKGLWRSVGSYVGDALTSLVGMIVSAAVGIFVAWWLFHKYGIK